MSKVEMNKITIIGKKGTEEDILEELIKEGFVQVDDISYLADDEEFQNVFNRIDKESINKMKIQVEKAINITNKINNLKKPMFYSKLYFIELTEKEATDIYMQAEEINNIEQEIYQLEEQMADLEKKKAELFPWKNLEISGEDLASLKYIKVLLGKIPSQYKISQIESDLKSNTNNYSINFVNQDKKYTYIYLTCYSEDENNVKDIMKKIEFFEEDIILDADETIEQKIKNIEDNINNIKSKVEFLKGKIVSENLTKFENLYDYFVNQEELINANKNLVTTKNLFYLEGWIPAGRRIKNKKDYIIKYRKPEEDEDYPIYLKNNNLVTPFESITNMYSVPSIDDVDPNPVMSFFFIAFFGMMLSDLGYGLILALLSAFVVKKAHYKKGEGSLFKLLIPCGISAMIWGIVFGSCFGDLIKIKPIINPLTDVMLLIGLAWILGLVQIYVGLFVKGIQLIKKKQIFSAIFDIGFWYLTLTGVVLLIAPIIAGDLGIWSTIGKYLAIVGVIGLVLTQGRDKKNLIGKLIGGVGSLYNITGYVADVLSYSRLMALCLSTGVIAQVGNLLAQMTNPVLGVIITILVHTVNIANSALGSYVHTSRLQYIEFFGKFYEGGGTEFKPLKMKNKYTNIKEDF